MLKSLRAYAVHSMFLTIQGEGLHAGRRAVFLRFSGCNVWNGVQEDRERDAGQNSACAAICDTEFKGCDLKQSGGMHDVSMIIKHAKSLWGSEANGVVPFIVITGGEPSLQIDEKLVKTLKAEGFEIAVETNGTRKLPDGVDWVTLSPKFPMPFADQRYNELKVLSIFLEDYKEDIWLINATFRFVQPTEIDGLNGPRTLAERVKCLDFVLANPAWRMGSQNHKYWGVK